LSAILILDSSTSTTSFEGCLSMNRQLWPEQVEALANLRASIGQGVRRIVLRAPTGSGKTIISAAIVEGAQRKNNRMAFVVSSISLVDQTVEKFWQEGIRDIGVIQANHQLTDWSKPVQVCSIATLKSRGAYPGAKIVIVDECHVLHEFQKQWMSDPAWQNVPFIGLSATPGTRGLGKYFHSLLTVSTTEELIQKGRLSPFTVYACPKADISQVKIVAGDYHQEQLSSAMRAGTLTADVVRTWQERWGKDKTLVFGVDRQHAETLHHRFMDAGVRSAYQDANTPDRERKEIERGFHDGTYQVVCNIGTLTVGVDWDVRCLVLARPTRSEMLYVQIIGRALRTAPGKDKAIILDHSDTTAELGLVTDIHFDHLDDGKPRQAPEKAAERRKPLPRPCPHCSSLAPRLARTCPDCGFKLPLASGVVERDGVLIEYVPSAIAKKGGKREYTMAEKEAFYAQLLGYAREHDYKDGWASNKYREKFEVWPNGMRHVQPAEPSFEIATWIRSRNIAWAKSKRRAERLNQVAAE
jgi:superfamily II DNA or RNA helicase